MNTPALVRVCVLGVAFSGASLATPAWADCSPQAANGVTATCTGTTNKQGGGAPGTSAGNNGYGTGTETGVTVTVVGGAANAVSGNNGIYLGNGTVINGAGASITGSSSGIQTTNGSVEVTNSGGISGSFFFGILANINATVTNNAGGSITGGDSGIIANRGFANVTNSGSIIGTLGYGIDAGTDATVTNNAGGSITGGGYGIYAVGGGSSVFNAGRISGGTAAIQFSGTGNTLTLAQGSVITGNVLGTGSDTFQLGGTGAATFDVSQLGPKYQGFSTFNKIDSSVWTLTGTSTFAGPVNVNGGMLAVDGDITSMSGVIVNAGGLAGTGSVGIATINTGGTFAPGNGTPGSSMTVASLAMQSGAFYAVNLNPTTSSYANVTGNASLGGATVAANFATASGYVVKQYTILNAGSISGAFDPTVINTNLPSGLKTSLSYDTTHAYLDLALAFIPPSGGPFSGNQSSVGNAIVNYFNTNGGIPLVFGGLTPQGLTQVSGEIGGSAQSTSFQASTQFMNIMSDPTAAGRGGAGSAGGAGGGAGGATGYADEAANESMAYAGKPKSNNPRDAFASFTKAPPQSFVQRWSTWVTGYGGSQTTDSNAAAGTNTSSSNIYGVAVGADYRVSWDTVAGFALSGGGTNYSVAGGGTGRSDMFQLGAFVRHNIGATYLTASAAYGWQDVTTDRYVTVAGVDHLKAEFNTNSYSGRLELGHRFLQPWFGGLGVSPYAAVQITAFELPAYAEQAVTGNNTFALAYGANTSTATRSELGLRTDKSYALDGAVLTLRGRAAWAHDFNPNSAVSATFQTLPGASFVVNGVALSPDAALTTASAEVSWINGWSVAATFEGEFSDVTRSYAGKGVVRYNW